MRYFAPLPSGTPGWFVERDTRRRRAAHAGGILPRLRTTEVAEFKRYDLNGDGLLDRAELVRRGRLPGGGRGA